MKFQFLYLLLFVIVLTSGCLGNKNSSPAPALVPSGTFTGQFRLIRTKMGTLKHDTSITIIQLVLNATTGFKVIGDTAIIHAGSHGSYALNTSYIKFTDATYPKTGIPAKTHLNSIYEYYYDGSVFQMLASSPLDTVVLQYDMKLVSQ